jgi:nicotinate-nucleotide adenylyltransferase
MASAGSGTPHDAPSAQPGVAVLGGSFNPPHESHRRIAAQALDQLPVQRLLAIPSGDHPHKQGRDMAPAQHRLAMARLAFDGIAGVEVDDRELHRDGPSYTVDTLRELQQQLPGTRLFFLIGSDNLPLLPTWYGHHQLLELATVVTWPRRGYPIDPARLRALDLSSEECQALLAHVLDLPADDVAASDLRERLRRGEPRPPMLPAAVADYVQRNGLYR